MDKFFKISERKSTVSTEIIAGLTTFFARSEEHTSELQSRE